MISERTAESILQHPTDRWEARLTVVPITITIESGDKLLELNIDSFDCQARTNIHKINGAEKLEGSTRRVYKRALEVMQEIANALQEPLKYEFSTANAELMAWVKDPGKGGSVFNWGNEDIIEDSDKRFHAKKEFLPEKSSKQTV